jgi:hypothetical protein
VKISGRILKGRKPRSSTPRRKPGPAQAKAKDIEVAPSQPQPVAPLIEGKRPSEILLMHLDPNEMDDEQQAAVWTLMKYFKSRGL